MGIFNKKKSSDKNQELEDLKKEVDVDFHTVEQEVLISRLESNKETGLTLEKAVELLEKNGPNRLTPPKNESKILKFLKELVTGFSLLLNLGGILCFIAYGISYSRDPNSPSDNLYLGIVLIVVVLITTIFSFYQELKSNKIMESFKKLVPQESILIREGKKINIRADEIVIGDIVLLRGGDLIPADVIVIEAKSFKVDNSSLTGESEPQKRFPQCTNTKYLETANVAFAFTYAVEGTCKGIVVSTGDSTVMGRIARLTSSLEVGKTPIGIEIEKFIKLITIIAFAIGILFFILSLTVAKADFISSIVFLIGIIVANVPEGLLVTVTLALTLTAKRMAKKNCLVKNLQSVETLGSTSVICSDKTGTLTQNRMTASHVWYDEKVETIDTSENALRTKYEGKSEALKMLFNISALCNQAEFREDQDFNVPVLRLITNGDASESALIKYVELYYGTLTEIRMQNKKVFEIPFNSVNKYQISVHEQGNEDERYLVVMKGAPERIIDRCQTIIINNEIKDVNEDYKDKFNKAYEEMGGMGERVLGFCYAYLSVEEFPRGCQLSEEDLPKFSLEKFTFAGLISLIDPPRAAVPRAVELCKEAGIKVIMVTGDHPITAKAIAKNVGIITNKTETFEEMKARIERDGEDIAIRENVGAIISGTDLKDMSIEDLDNIIKYHEEIVFARTSPQQKLLIVEGFQRSGAVVAVTGDGVNDSPALRKADIGIAMGIAGSDVAKQAAKMILLDDNFASIVTGVEQGRLIFDNLKKSIAYTLTSNIPEVAPFLVHILGGIPLPLGTITILCIDLGTDLVPAISYAYEKPETDIMKRMPRNAQVDSLVNKILINYSYLLVGILQAISAFVVYVFIMLDNGFEWNKLQFYDKWTSSQVPFVTDNFGQQWNYAARKELEYTCYTAYFFTIVIVQWADLIISRTRKVSIFTHSFFSNRFLLFGLCFETVLALIISYVPVLNIPLQTRGFHPKYLFVSIFFSYLLWLLDELRRFYNRRNLGSFIEKETYY